MKGFRLAGLLRIRALEEQRAAAELAGANRAVGAARGRRSRSRAALGRVRSDPADAAALSAVVAARASAHILLGELASLHERAAQEAVDAGSRHAAARVNELTLEKLHDRHLAAGRAAELRAEQAALDEIAIQGWRTAQEEDG